MPSVLTKNKKQVKLAQSKIKRKSHRKAIKETEERAYRKKLQTIEKWVKDYYESRAEYPVTKSKKKLTWAQIRKFLKTTK